MVPKIESNALRDLITVCLLLDAETCARRNAGSCAGRQFFYLETLDGLRRVVVSTAHVSLTHLNHTCADLLKQILAAADGKLPVN